MKLKCFSGTDVTLALPKTWVRVPGLNNSHIIFQFEFTCSANIEAYHTLQHQLIHASQEVYQRVQNKGTWWTPVNMPHLSGKVNKLPANGPGFSNPHPPGLLYHFYFYSFFNFFSFYFFLLFI